MEEKGGKEYSAEQSPNILLDDIFSDMHFGKDEGIRWKKTLEENLYDTVESIDELSSEDWEAMKIPFSVLYEFKKRYNPKAKHNIKILAVDRRHSSDILKTIDKSEQSFQDLSQFMKISQRSNSEDFKRRKWIGMKLRSKKPEQVALKTLRIPVNFIGRENHAYHFLSTYFGEPNLKSFPTYLTEVSIYGYEVKIDIFDCVQSASQSPEVIVIIFAKDSLLSLHKMMEKWMQTKEKQKIATLLVGIDTNTKNSKAVAIDKAIDALKEFNGIRYFEISNQEDSREVFTEIARIKIRSIEVQPRDLSLKISKYVEKKSLEIDFKKRGISLLPNSIYSISQFAQKIRLENNNIKFFPTELILFNQLQELYLSFNQIEEIPFEISNLQNLIKLDLENNLLESLPILSIQAMKNLQELKVKGNPMTRLPDELKGKSSDILPAIRSFNFKEENNNNNNIIEEDMKIFAVPLNSLLLFEKKFYNLKTVPLLPKIAFESINFLLKFGIQLEGIFRMAGQNVRCTTLKEEIDNSLSVKFSDTENPHDIANLFKQWLRDLPEPLFLFSNFDKIISISSLSEEEKNKELAKILTTLPVENYHLIRQIFRLMYIVGINSETNRMDFGNITKVVCPNLLYPKIPSSDPFKSMTDMTVINDVLLLLTQNFPLFFEGNEINLFKAETLLLDKAEVLFYRKKMAHLKSITASSLSSNSKVLWTADSRGILKLWNSSNLELIQTIDTTKRRVNCIANHNQKMWIGTIDGIEVRDENTGELEKEMEGISTFTMAIINNQICVGDSTKLILFSAIDYTEKRVEITSETLTIIVVDKTIWAACRDNKIHIWNENFEEIKEFEPKHESKVSSLALVGDFIWTWDNSTIFAWNKEGIKVTALEKNHLRIFGAKTIGNRGWTFNWKGNIHYYHPSTFEYCGEIFTYHNDAVSSIEIVYDENLKCNKVFSVSWDKSIICWLLKPRKSDSSNSLSIDKKKKRKHIKRRITPTPFPPLDLSNNQNNN